MRGTHARTHGKHVKFAYAGAHTAVVVIGTVILYTVVPVAYLSVVLSVFTPNVGRPRQAINMCVCERAHQYTTPTRRTIIADCPIAIRQTYECERVHANASVNVVACITCAQGCRPDGHKIVAWRRVQCRICLDVDAERHDVRAHCKCISCTLVRTHSHTHH